MEASSCVKAVAVAATKYNKAKNENTQIYLQRQLDVLISITGDGKSLLSFFHPNEILSTDCLSSLVDILCQEQQPHCTVVLKILQLFTNLVFDEQIQMVLCKKYDLVSCLAKLLCAQETSHASQVSLSCLNLLELVTYGAKVTMQDAYIMDLVSLLIKTISAAKKKNVKLNNRSIGVLANLSKNFSVQTYIKNMEEVTSLYKSLTKNLSEDDHSTVIFSLKCLANLALHSSFGDMLFNARNIHQTFQLIFTILLECGKNTTRRYAIDLLSDLLQHSKIKELLTQYKHLDLCIKDILSLLCETDQESVTQVFKLLLCLSSASGIRRVVCQRLFTLPGIKSVGSYSSLLQASSVTEPLFGVIRWATLDSESHGEAPVLAVSFLKEVYEEAIDQNMTAENTRLDLTIQMLNTILDTPEGLKEPHILKKMFNKIVKALQLLTTLCADDIIREDILKGIDIKRYTKLLEHQFVFNKINFSSNKAAVLEEYSETGVEVVLYGLELMNLLKPTNAAVEMNTVLQDSRLTPFLAYGISSEQRDTVRLALKLISLGSQLPEFPHILLGDCIAACNAYRQVSSEENTDTHNISIAASSNPFLLRSHIKENIPLRTNTSLNSSKKAASDSDMDASIQMLIEKMQTGLDVKDMKSAEVISLYEHQLQSLQTKGEHLQDLLDAKTNALAQADRLISQFRFRQAEFEAEGHKMRSLLQESESRYEQSKEELNEVRLEKEQMSLLNDQQKEEVNRLRTVETEHTKLLQAFAEQSEKLESTERSLSSLRMEHKTKCEMYETLHRHGETLKHQYETASQQLEKLEKERKSLSQEVKEYSTKLQELNKLNKKHETELVKINKERNQLSSKVEQLEQVLAKTEQKRKDLQHQVSSLDLVCRQHEASLKEKEESIAIQKAEIDKHAMLMSNISKLCSGRSPFEVNSSQS